MVKRGCEVLSERRGTQPAVLIAYGTLDLFQPGLDTGLAVEYGTID